MIKLGGLSGYLYKGRKRKARLHLEYPLVFVLGDSLGYFNINQYSEEWTGLRDRLFMFFFPHVNFPNELSVTPSKRFSPQVVASRFFFYAVSQPWPGSSATTRIIPKSPSWPRCLTDGKNCRGILRENWAVKPESI